MKSDWLTAMSISAAACVAAAISLCSLSCSDAATTVDGSSGDPTNDGGSVVSDGGVPDAAMNTTDAGTDASSPPPPPAGSMTIAGSGFGAKVAPGPVIFDDFEAGAVGAHVENQPAVVGKWETGAGSTSPVYSDAVVREGSRSCKHPFTHADYNSSLARNIAFTKSYVDFWVYAAPVDTTEPSGLSRNWKPFRMYGDHDALQAGITTMQGFSSTIAYFEPANTSYFGGGDWPRRKWVHVQFWLKLNDVGQANGLIRGRWNDNEVSKGNLQMRTSAAQTMNELRVGHYWAGDSVAEWPYTNPGANVYTDTVYFDTSWARVEIGDAPTYAASTHREIQLVTAWSDTSVTFKVQRGTLAPGSYYVYVIDDTDQVRATKPIQL